MHIKSLEQSQPSITVRDHYYVYYYYTTVKSTKEWLLKHCMKVFVFFRD